MYTKSTLISAYKKFLRTHHLHANMVVVGAGSACVMHDVRIQTQDIDVQVPLRFFTEMRDSGKFEIKTFPSTFDKKIMHQSVECEDGFSLHIGDDVADVTTTTMIDGVCCYSLDTLLAQKQALNRPKDQDDIKALLALKKKQAPAASWK